jgi:hypothetical protein
MLIRLRPLLLLTVAVAPIPRAAADAPSVSSFFPAGATRGGTVSVKAEGSFKPWPVNVSVDRPGIEFKPGEEAGTFEVSVSEDTPPGPCWVRISNNEGAAPLRPFLIGLLPEVAEVEPNDANDKAQQIEPSPVIVNGRLEKSGDVDAFSVPLESGQTLVAALDANQRLGSPMDGVLQVVSPEGFVLDHADDSPGFDPALSFTAPTSGNYLIRVFAFPATPDSSIRFAGGNDYVYRLTLTTGGILQFAHPSAICSDEDRPLSPVGWNIPEGDDPLRIAPGPGDQAITWRDDLPGVAEVDRVRFPVATEPEAGTEPIALPALICGRIGSTGEADAIPVQAPEGRPFRIRALARSLGSPLDPVLKVLDSSGEELAESDDANRRDRDAEVTVKAPADGILNLQIRDLHGQGGDRYIYRIEAAEVAPDVSLSLESDHVELQPGKPLEVTVTIDRRDGFDRPITFEVEGLPEGISLQPAVSEPKGDSSKKVTLSLSGEDTSPWAGTIHILGRAEGDGSPRSALADRVGGPPTPDLWLTVKPAQ